MIGRAPAKKSRLALAAFAAGGAAFTLACGASYLEIPIETPIQAKLDVSAFQRVLVAGFVTGGDTHLMTPLPGTVYGPDDWEDASLDDWLNPRDR